MHPESAAEPSAEGALRPYLEHFAEMGGPIQRVALLALPFVLGRSETAGHTIYSSKVSKEHAAILVVDGKYAVRDLNSTNGTFVNGERVEEHLLADGDIIHVAHVEFRFRHQVITSAIVGTRGVRPVERTQVVVESDRPDSLIRGAQLLDELIATGAVAILYQPIVDLQTRQIAGYEALGRGTLDELGSDPEALLKLAAQCGKVIALSQLFRRCSLASSARLVAGAKLFLNVHAAELDDASLIESMASLAPRLANRPVVMEIAESSVTDVAAMAETKRSFRHLDLELAYDDFGAGQARLNELIETPPDYLKLDKSLVQGLDISSARREMVSALVKVAKGLRVLTIAEGIETEAVAEACRELGCDLGQGYFFGVPA